MENEMNVVYLVVGRQVRCMECGAILEAHEVNFCSGCNSNVKLSGGSLHVRDFSNDFHFSF